MNVYLTQNLEFNNIVGVFGSKKLALESIGDAEVAFLGPFEIERKPQINNKKRVEDNAQKKEEVAV